MAHRTSKNASFDVPHKTPCDMGGPIDFNNSSSPFLADPSHQWGISSTQTRLTSLESTIITPGKLACHLKRDHIKRKIVFQPAILRGYVGFRGNISN